MTRISSSFLLDSDTKSMNSPIVESETSQWALVQLFQFVFYFTVSLTVLDEPLLLTDMAINCYQLKMLQMR